MSLIEQSNTLLCLAQAKLNHQQHHATFQQKNKVSLEKKLYVLPQKTTKCKSKSKYDVYVPPFFSVTEPMFNQNTRH